MIFPKNNYLRKHFPGKMFSVQTNTPEMKKEGCWVGFRKNSYPRNEKNNTFGKPKFVTLICVIYRKKSVIQLCLLTCEQKIRSVENLVHVEFESLIFPFLIKIHLMITLPKKKRIYMNFSEQILKPKHLGPKFHT